MPFSNKVESKKTLSIRNPLGLMSFCRFRIATFCTHHALPPTTNRRPLCSRDPYRDMPRHSPSLIVISFATSRHSFRSVIMARFTLRTFDGQLTDPNAFTSWSVRPTFPPSIHDGWFSKYGYRIKIAENKSLFASNRHKNGTISTT